LPKAVGLMLVALRVKLTFLDELADPPATTHSRSSTGLPSLMAGGDSGMGMSFILATVLRRLCWSNVAGIWRRGRVG
jgi:hypothetical protein